MYAQKFIYIYNRKDYIYGILSLGITRGKFCAFYAFIILITTLMEAIYGNEIFQKDRL
jgi:hypothetical protein